MISFLIKFTFSEIIYDLDLFLKMLFVNIQRSYRLMSYPLSKFFIINPDLIVRQEDLNLFLA